MNPENSDPLASRWHTLQQGKSLNTPTKRKTFEISSITPSEVTITTQGGTNITIKRQAFLAVVKFLTENKHNSSNKVEIASNKVRAKAGPLCLAARAGNGSTTMVITYILPILADIGLVGIDSNIPTRTWLI